MSGLIGSIGSPSGIIGRRSDNQIWCRMVMHNSGGAQGFTSAAQTKVGLDAVKESYGLGMGDTSNEYMVVPTGLSGWWLVTFQVSYYTASNNITDHYTKIDVQRGGSSVEKIGGYHSITDTGGTRHAMDTSSKIVNLLAGDILILYGRSDGTNPVFFYGDDSGTYQTYMQAIKINDSTVS